MSLFWDNSRMQPLFTIITSTYNAEEVLPCLLDSLATQTYRNFEWVMQDGYSTDDTVAIAKSYEVKLPYISISSEKDSGIYDAWNKALQRINGEWVLFLGADDKLLTSQALEHLAQFICTKVNEKVIYVTSSVRCGNNIFVPEWPLSSKIKRQMPFPHQGLLHKASLFRTNQFSPKLQIAGDYDFLLKTIKLGESANYPRVISLMGQGGVSQDLYAKQKMHKEYFHIIRKHFGIVSACKRPLLKLAVSTIFNSILKIKRKCPLFLL